MTTSHPDFAISTVLFDRQLLDHPFYRRWEQGAVSIAELASYAAQYRYFERFLPRFLARLEGSLPRGTARDLIAANLADEEGNPVPHVELFERFASAVGATADPPTPATSALVGCYEELLAAGPLPALAGFTAYESQSGAIARRKADGLRRDHGLDDDAVRFWEHHAEVDAAHGAWAERALEESAHDAGALIPSIRRAADGWWAFLDDREALALLS